MIGGHLRAQRVALGMRQVDVARAAGCSVTWIRLLEQGLEPEKGETLSRVHEVLFDLHDDQSPYG